VIAEGHTIPCDLRREAASAISSLRFAPVSRTAIRSPWSTITCSGRSGSANLSTRGSGSTQCAHASTRCPRLASIRCGPTVEEGRGRRFTSRPRPVRDRAWPTLARASRSDVAAFSRSGRTNWRFPGLPAPGLCRDASRTQPARRGSPRRSSVGSARRRPRRGGRHSKGCGGWCRCRRPRQRSASADSRPPGRRDGIGRGSIRGTSGLDPARPSTCKLPRARPRGSRPAGSSVHARCTRCSEVRADSRPVLRTAGTGRRSSSCGRSRSRRRGAGRSSEPCDHRRGDAKPSQAVPRAFPRSSGCAPGALIVIRPSSSRTTFTSSPRLAWRRARGAPTSRAG
jgi:hypothetical protein